MKSQLIDDFLSRLRKDGTGAATVLDLACGKGGDLNKWRIGGIKKIVMTDVAEVALEHCKDRYEESCSGAFSADFVVADSMKSELSDLLRDKNIQFDLCSCQFALHYSFISEECARRFIFNATSMLRPGGYFIGTVTDATRIVKLLRRDGGVFKNDVCRIEYTSEKPDDFANFKIPLFGAQLNFELEEVVNCPEYLAYWPLIVKILEDYGMELIYSHSFADAVQHYLSEKGKSAENLMGKMKALEAYPPNPNDDLSAEVGEYKHAEKRLSLTPEIKRVGTLSKSEWEVVSMYRTFAFRKKLE